jgi:hypothetical protein
MRRAPRRILTRFCSRGRRPRSPEIIPPVCRDQRPPLQRAAPACKASGVRSTYKVWKKNLRRQIASIAHRITWLRSDSEGRESGMAEEPYNPSPIGNPSVLARRNWLQTKLVIFIGKHTPKCRDMVRILSQSDGRAVAVEHANQETDSLPICCWCQRYEEHLYYLRKMARSFPEHADESSNVSVSSETKERWRQAVRRG